MRRPPRSGRIDRDPRTPIVFALILGVLATARGQDGDRPEPKDAASYTSRGDARLRGGDPDRAIADFTKAIALDPGNARAYSQRGSAWREKHEYRRAIADFSAAIALEPGNHDHYLLRGSVLSRQGDHAPAMADFDEAIRLDPNDAGAYTTRAIEWEKDLRLDRALSDYQRAIALDPRAILAYDGRGRIWRKVGEYGMVVANYAELARIVPDHPLGHRELAWILATCDQDAIRDGRRALGEATTACELTKWADPVCVEGVAAARAELGDFDAAVRWQARALAIFHAHSDRVDRRIVARKTQDADMSHRLYRYKKRLPYRERPDRAVR